MSFYSRGYGGLVRFPGLGGFGDVAEATDTLNAAKAKVNSLKAKVASQEKLIAATHVAIKLCTEGGSQIVGNILSGGVAAALCLADQNNQLGQRSGILVQFQAELDAAKADVQNAQEALNYAKEQAALPPEQRDALPYVAPGVGASSEMVGSSSMVSSGGIGSMLSNPLVLAAGAGVVILGAFLLTRRSGGAVAGYRRRRR